MSAIVPRFLQSAFKTSPRSLWQRGQNSITHRPWVAAGLATALLCLGSSWLAEPSRASLAQPIPRSQLKFPPTNNNGSVGRTTGGASRSGDPGACPADTKQVPIMLLPESGLGKSAEATPMVYVYVPKLISPTSAEIKVNQLPDNKVNQITDSEEVASQSIALSGKEGIVKFPLLSKDPKYAQAAKIQALKPGVTYAWSFSIICDSSDRSIDRYAIGGIEHEPLTSEIQEDLAKVPKGDELGKAGVFAKREFWFDALNSVVQVRLKNEKDSNWASFLDSVDLSQIKKAQFIDLGSETSQRSSQR